MRALIFLFVVLSTVAASLLANQERPVAFSTLRFESIDDARAGKVIVEARQDASGKTLALNVTAFGKSYSIPKDQLTGFTDGRWNGIRVIYDGGIFGRTVWVYVDVSLSWGTREQMRIGISGDGTIRVLKAQDKNA